MPRLLKLRVAALQRIAHELRFAPAAAARRQTAKAEKLTSMIDPKAVYPEDFVVYHITGFRPEIAEPELIPGDALLRDLAALIDRLSRRAAFTRDELAPSAWLTTEDLLKRWGVSRKTIERLRPRGLIGRRVALPRGKAMNVYSIAVVKAVEKREHPTPVVRTKESASTQRTKQSKPAIKPAVTPKQRRLVERALRAGVKPKAVAARLSKSKATVFRSRQQQLAERCRAVRVPIPAAAAEIIEHEGLRFLADPSVRSGLGVPGARSIAEHVADALRIEKPDPLTERTRAFAYWTLVTRAQGAARLLDRTRPAALTVDRVTTDLRWAALIKAELVRAEQQLLLRTIEVQLGTPLLELPPLRASTLLARCIAALSGAVDRFDPTAGRIAGVASMELSRAVTRWQSEQNTPTTPGTRAQAIEPAEHPIDDWTRAVCPWQAWTNPPPGIRDALARLDPPQRSLITARYGLDGSPPRDTSELAAMLKKPARIITRLLRTAERAAAAQPRPRRPRGRPRSEP